MFSLTLRDSHVIGCEIHETIDQEQLVLESQILNSADPNVSIFMHSEEAI